MADEQSTAGRVSDATSSRGLAGKRDYVRSLEQRRDEAALGLLVECLCDESGYLRELAESALLKIGERAGPVLLPLLGQGLWFSRSSAARVLGQMGYGPSAGPLLKLTGDSVETVVREAYVALTALGQRGGSTRVAWELHRLAPEQRHERMARLQLTDRDYAEHLQRLLRAGDLMSRSDPETLRDDSPRVRESEHGIRSDGPPAGAGTSSSPGSTAATVPTTPTPSAAHGVDTAAH
jgi:HEAT repeat protein